MRQRPSWGPDASTRKVRVRFRERRQGILGPNGGPLYTEQVSVRTMGHKEYFNWLENVERKTVQLVGVEQVED